MSRRGIVINSLINSIAETTGASGYRGMRFLHEVNSFPAFYVHAGSEKRVHISDGVRYGLIEVSIRGYQWSDSLDSIETFARDIERAVNSFYRASRDIVEEARVTSLSTDEGTLSPYGAVDIQITVLYAAYDGNNQPVKTINYTLLDNDGNALLSPAGDVLSIPAEFK